MSEDNTIRESMIESLEEDPDGAVLITMNNAEADESDDVETAFSMFVDEGGELEREHRDLARRLLAMRSAQHVAKYFPNEISYGSASATGGQFTAVGDSTFINPEIEWERGE